MNLQRIGAFAVLIGSLAVVNMPAQSQGPDNDPGLFGPVTVHPKAGDFAPDVTFTQLLSSPDSASWSSANLSGNFCRISLLAGNCRQRAVRRRLGPPP